MVNKFLSGYATDIIMLIFTGILLISFPKNRLTFLKCYIKGSAQVIQRTLETRAEKIMFSVYPALNHDAYY